MSWTRNRWAAAIRKNPSLLADTPLQYRDYDLCMDAVLGDGYELGDVPDELRDKRMCIAALKNCRIIQYMDPFCYVPQELREDRDVCMAAVENDGVALVYVPERLRDYEMCLAAVMHSSTLRERLSAIPKSVDAYGLYREAVVRGLPLRLVPEQFRTRELCSDAIANGEGLDHVPENAMTREMCLSAVKRYGFELRNVPARLMDRDMRMAAVTATGVALMLVPEKERDREICLAAVRKDGLALEYVPRALRDCEMCAAAIRQDANASVYVPYQRMEELEEFCAEMPPDHAAATESRAEMGVLS